MKLEIQFKFPPFHGSVDGCFIKVLLKLINNESSLKKGHNDRDGVWLVFFLVLVLIEKIYETPMTVLDHVSKHLSLCQ